MSRQRKTYALYGQREAIKIIHSNGAFMNVHFENGRKTRAGEVPATFMTEDLFTQIFIENSDEFKANRVKLYSIVELPGGDEEEVETESGSDNSTSEEATAARNADAEMSAVNGVVSGTLKEVEAPDKDWAQSYLIDNFPEKNYAKSRLRSYDDIAAAARECGITLVFPGKE